MRFSKTITFLFFVLLFLFQTSTSLAFYKKSNDSHAIYIGVVQMSHVENRPSADIIVKVFQDDLQDVLKNAFDLKKMEAEIAYYNQYQLEIEQYFQNHLSCSINGQSMSLRLKKGEKAAEVYLLSFEIACPEVWKTVDIRADFFMELFPIQSNILHVENGKKKRFGRMKKDTDELRFEF